MMKGHGLTKVFAIASAIAFASAVSAHAQYNPESDFNVARASDGNGVIINGFAGTGTVVNIPPVIRGLPVVEIANNAFRGLGLTDVSIPDGVTAIGRGAFANNLLTNIVIPDSVNMLGGAIFADMGDGAFRNNQLTSVTIGRGITAIPSFTFDRNHLATVTIPDWVTAVGCFAFGRNPVTTVIIGANVRIYHDNPAFDRDSMFVEFYRQSNSRAGTYVFRGNLWGEEW